MSTPPSVGFTRTAALPLHALDRCEIQPPSKIQETIASLATRPRLASRPREATRGDVEHGSNTCHAMSGHCGRLRVLEWNRELRRATEWLVGYRWQREHDGACAVDRRRRRDCGERVDERRGRNRVTRSRGHDELGELPDRTERGLVGAELGNEQAGRTGRRTCRWTCRRRQTSRGTRAQFHGARRGSHDGALQRRVRRVFAGHQRHDDRCHDAARSRFARQLGGSHFRRCRERDRKLGGGRRLPVLTGRRALRSHPGRESRRTERARQAEFAALPIPGILDPGSRSACAAVPRPTRDQNLAVPVSNNPALVGLSVDLQALSVTSVSPPAGGFSNVLNITFFE